MEPQRNVKHEFDLSGLNSGDSFLGCPQCWFRFSPTELARPKCPQCRSKMKIYDVTNTDIELRDWKDALEKYSTEVSDEVGLSDVMPSWVFMFGQFWYENDPPERKELFRNLMKEREPEMTKWLESTTL